MKIKARATPANLAFRETFLAQFPEKKRAAAVRRFGQIFFASLVEGWPLRSGHVIPLPWTYLLEATAKDLDSLASVLEDVAQDFARQHRADRKDFQARDDEGVIRGFEARAKELARDIAATAQQWLREDEEGGERPAADPEQSGVGAPQ